MKRPDAFISFVVHFYRYARYLREVLVLMVLLLLLGALAISFIEDIRLGEAVYFAFITGLTIGYGDISPTTSAGRTVSVLIGFVGLIFNGVVVATATRALRDATANREH